MGLVTGNLNGMERLKLNVITLHAIAIPMVLGMHANSQIRITDKPQPKL